MITEGSSRSLILCLDAYLADAEAIAVEHYLWLRSQSLTHRQMYASIGEQPPKRWQGGDGVVRAIARKWMER